MSALPQLLGEVSALAAYCLLAVAVLAESVMLIGAFVPTLTLMLTAGARARFGTLHMGVVVPLAAAAVVAGDAFGHRVGWT